MSGETPKDHRRVQLAISHGHDGVRSIRLCSSAEVKISSFQIGKEAAIDRLESKFHSSIRAQTRWCSRPCHRLSEKCMPLCHNLEMVNTKNANKLDGAHQRY